MDTLTGVESLCDTLGVKTKLEKRTPPTTTITFLGIQLDTVARVASLPQEKLASIVTTFRDLSKCTKRSLLSLIGKLVFAVKVIPAGRIFVRRLLDGSTKVTSLHHHIRLSAAMQADIDWWLRFAREWNRKSFFLSHEWTPSPAFQLYTDASQLGYGCYWQGHWLCGQWSKQQLKHNIQWKELYAVVVVANAWGALR